MGNAGQGTMGWFYGFKLHLLINHVGEIISQIEHRRHRSSNGFIINLISGLVAYCLKKKKPKIKLADDELKLI